MMYESCWEGVHTGRGPGHCTVHGDWVWAGNRQLAALAPPDPRLQQRNVILDLYDGYTAAKEARGPRRRDGHGQRVALTWRSPPPQRAAGVFA